MSGCRFGGQTVNLSNASAEYSLSRNIRRLRDYASPTNAAYMLSLDCIWIFSHCYREMARERREKGGGGWGEDPFWCVVSHTKLFILSNRFATHVHIISTFYFPVDAPNMCVFHVTTTAAVDAAVSLSLSHTIHDGANLAQSIKC